MPYASLYSKFKNPACRPNRGVRTQPTSVKSRPTEPVFERDSGQLARVFLEDGLDGLLGERRVGDVDL